MDDFLTSIKYIAGAFVSTLMSYTLWRYKKKESRLDTLNRTVDELSTDQRVVDIEIKMIKEDVVEIKETLKEILRRL